MTIPCGVDIFDRLLHVCALSTLTVARTGSRVRRSSQAGDAHRFGGHGRLVPKLRDSLRRQMRESRADTSSSHAAVPSVLPSSTKWTSCGPSGRSASTASSHRTSSGRLSILL